MKETPNQARYRSRPKLVMILAPPLPGDAAQFFPLVPGFDYEIIAVQTTLDTTVGGFSTAPFLQAANGGVLLWNVISAVPSLVATVTFVTFASGDVINAIDFNRLTIPCGRLWVPNNSTLSVLGDGLSPGDTWTNTRLLARAHPVYQD